MSEQISRVRWKICTFMLLAVAVSFLDRLNIGVLGKPLQEQFHIGNTQLGAIFSAFGIGYALFQVPGGMLADRIGPRRVITAAVILWSCLTALCACADRLPVPAWVGLPASLAAVRLLIGIAQAPLFTSANRVVANWMPPLERARGNSLFVMGVGLGGVVTPPLMAWLMQFCGWRLSFVICGIVGLILATAWHIYSTEQPEQHAGVNRIELNHIRGNAPGIPASRRKVPWATIFTNRNVLLLILSYGLQGYTTYVFYTWFYLYVVNVRKLPSLEAGFWSSVPFAAFGLMSLAGGWCSDSAVRRLGGKSGRRICAFIGLFGASTILLIGSRIPNPYIAVVVLSMGAGFNAFSTVSFWAASIDISREYAGSVSGLMNMAGNIAGAIAPTLTPYLADRYGWTAAIDFAALMIGSAGLVWFFIDAGCRLLPAESVVGFERSAVPK